MDAGWKNEKYYLDFSAELKFNSGFSTMRLLLPLL